MNSGTEFHSFRRLLNSQDGEHREYVLSKHRYAGILRLLGKHVADASTLHALDIGCGAGVISCGLAGKFGRVTGVDRNPDNIVLAQSLGNEEVATNVAFRQGSATRLPVDNEAVDFALLNGVFEWVGLNDDGTNPQVLQRQVLAEVLRVLRPAGMLYLAIENRWHPRTLLRDPHTHLPLVNALPRPLADVVSKKLRGKPFQAHIYGYRKLGKMLASAGFSQIEVFSPFPGYQYPLFYVPLRPEGAALRAIASIDVDQVTEVLLTVGRSQDVRKALARMRRRAACGVLGLLTHDFAFLCRKR